MRKKDIPEVSEIEKLSFPSPWSSNIFFSELEKKSFAFYHVMEYRDRLTGYGGYWRIKNEAHLVTFAVHPSFRRRGLGAKLLEHLLKHAQDQSLDTITLEVRHSNLAAQRFYERFSFKKIAIRPYYYSDTDEDAIVYWKKL
ncbi:MAG: ribosomal protein S18-alanine N-acetyltransferase [bacterium]